MDSDFWFQEEKGKQGPFLYLLFAKCLKPMPKQHVFIPHNIKRKQSWGIQRGRTLPEDEVDPGLSAQHWKKEDPSTKEADAGGSL